MDPAWEWVWRAWWRLGAGDRPYMVQGVAAPLGATLVRSEPGFLPWTAVQRWAERHGLSDMDTALLDHCVQAMDAVFRAWWFEANKVRDGQ